MNKTSITASVTTLAVSILSGMAAESGTQPTARPAEPSRYTGTTYGEFSYAPGSKISEGSLSLGDLSTLQTRAGYLATIRESQDLSWSAGIDWQRFSFGVPSASPIPNTLQSISVPLGLSWKFDDHWTIRAQIAPGLYSDFEDIGGQDFNAPGAVGVSYAVNRDLVFAAQVGFDPRAKYPLLGGVGVRWHFADDWTLSLLFPKPRIEYALNESLTLFAGGSFYGGTFAVGRDFGSRHGRPELDHQIVDYRDIRVGLGARYAFNSRFTAEVDGGWLVDRRFHYFDRDLLLNGDGAGYVGLSLKYTY